MIHVKEEGFTSSVTEGFSRFIFDLDLKDLREKVVNNCCIDLVIILELLTH